MVSVDKFYVYGGGRWREVDPGSGRIDGWGRAKFMVARGGKLLATRTRPVLAALRTLAAAQPSAARAGPDLPYKYPEQRRASKPAGCVHCQCCHNGINIPTNIKDKANVSVQCENYDLSQKTAQKQTSQSKVPQASKRKRDSSSDKAIHRKVITVATIHNSKPERKRRRISTDNETSKKICSNKRLSPSEDSQCTLEKPQKSPSLKLRRPGTLKRKRKSSSIDSSSTELSEERQKISSSKNYLQFESSKRVSKKTGQSQSLVLSSDDSDFQINLKNLKVKLSKTFKSNTSGIKEKTNPVKTLERSTNGPTKHKIGPKRAVESLSIVEPNKHKIGPKKFIESSSTVETTKHKIGPKRALESSSIVGPNKQKISPKKSIENSSIVGLNKYNIGPNKRPKSKENGNDQASIKARLWLSKQIDLVPRSQVTQIQNSAQVEAAKELVILESDIAILRLFLQNHYSDEELLKFDTDDNHKITLFYRINPLVCVVRCPRIAKMIQANDPDNISLVDFASKLGLKSISESSLVKTNRYRTRKRPNMSVNNNETSTDTENKENINRPSERSKNSQTKKPIKSTSKNITQQNGKIQESNKKRDENLERETRKRDIDTTVDTVEINSDSDANVPVEKTVEPAIKKPGLKGPYLKVYTDLEDHAIVSWVSVGGRANQVNGNRLWRQLQEQFGRITNGQGRTWHSLRNRYLRYILPRLGSLALPPAQQARLRAAAATGELKSRKKESRRNSIFALPPRGASSRRPGVPPRRADPPSEKGPPNNIGKEASLPPKQRAPSPRYSDVTRQFARKHPHQTSSERSHESTSEARRKSKRIQSPTAKQKTSEIKHTTEPRTRTSLQKSGSKKLLGSSRSESRSDDSSSGSKDNLSKSKMNTRRSNTHAHKPNRNSTDSWETTSEADTSESSKSRELRPSRASHRVSRGNSRVNTPDESPRRSKRPRSEDSMGTAKRRALEINHQSPESRGGAGPRPERLLRSDKKTRKLFNPKRVM